MRSQQEVEKALARLRLRARSLDDPLMELIIDMTGDALEWALQKDSPFKAFMDQIDAKERAARQ